MNEDALLLGTDKIDRSFPRTMFPDFDKVFACIQCGTCTASCPTARHMQYPPRKVFRLIQLGLREELLKSDAFWYCTTCYSCTVRCPRGISITETMQALKRLAIAAGVDRKKNSSRFYRAFMKTVRRTGRMQEMEVVTRWLLSTNPLQGFAFTKMGLALFRRGRMPLLPHSIRGLEQVRAMFSKAEEIEKREGRP
ncbi:MAG: 4Fe-4S dicluster domain-containing protein [Acidobacteria bacterium]|nr:4Fe-4S dicluster domain-containing protein [Acidobacteriota bacterium]